jgi:hypothetical protein
MPPKSSKKKVKEEKEDELDMSDSDQEFQVKGGRGRGGRGRGRGGRGRGRGGGRGGTKRKKGEEEEEEEEEEDEEKEKEKEEEKPSKKQKVEKVDVYTEIKNEINNATKENEFKKITSKILESYNRKDEERQTLLDQVEGRKQELKRNEEERQKNAAENIKKSQKSLNDFWGLDKTPLNGINKISAKGINNYIILNNSELMIKNKLFDILYKHVENKYPNYNEDSVLENMCLMLDSIHDFIGERTELTPVDKDLMIKTIFKVDNSKEDNFIYNSLKNLRAGDFENELFLWLLHSKKNDDLDIIKKVLFGDIISIAEQTKKDNLSSLFTIDAFNKSFEAYRKTLYYLSSDINKKDILENTNKNINKFLFRIKIIELYNALTDAIKNNKENKTYRTDGKWKYTIHILRNYIMYYDFQNLELKETNNDQKDLEDNIVSFFEKFSNFYKSQNKEYYIDIDELKKSINDILKNINIKNLTINDFDKVDIELLLKIFLEKIEDMSTEKNNRIKIPTMYDTPLDRYKNKSQTEEGVITKALEEAGKNQIETIINDVSGYIQFVAIPPQLFDANESTGGENMKILGIASKIKMVPELDVSFNFKLLDDYCSLKYDGSRNYIFDISNDNYPIKTIEIVSENFIVSQYRTGSEILLDKYAYKQDEKKLLCGSCPGVTDLFELYKYFTPKSEDDMKEDEEEISYKKDVLNNIFQIKRAGDYSQIEFCKRYNDKQKANENKLLFLSNDRMSSSFCLLLKVPFVAPVYSGVMGSETFCVYYNPYADRKRLYEENRMPITQEDIKELVIKLKILKVDCERMKPLCNLEIIDKYIKDLEKLKEDSNKYTLLSTLLVTQEIYDNNKYIVEKQKEINVATCSLVEMKVGDCLIESPARFFNEDKQIKYNVLYKQLTKLYYYIQSLSIDSKSEDLDNYVTLYNNIKEDMIKFFNSTPRITTGMSLLSEAIDYQEESKNSFDSDSSTNIKYVYNPLTKDISLKKYKHYNTVMFYNEKGYLLVQDFNPSAIIKINSIQKAKEQTYPDGTKITFKLN